MRAKKFRRQRQANFLRMYRDDLVREQDRRCYYCYSDITLADATFDHINPRAKGGRDRKENGCAACKACNSSKGDLGVKQFINLIEHPPQGALPSIRLANMRRRIGLASLQSCQNIKRAAGLKI